MRKGIIVYFLGVFFTLLSLGISFWLEKGIRIYILTISLPLLILIISDRLSHIFEHNDDNLSNRKFIKSLIPRSSSIRVFDNSCDAMSHLINQMKHAVKIQNTRFIDSSIEKENLVNDKITGHFDSLIESKIVKGLNYQLIVNNSHEEYVKSLIAKYSQKVPKNKNIGNFNCYEISNNINPMFNFIIVHYNDFSEVLFGWAVLDHKDYDEKVFLFSDKRIVDYFTRIYDQHLFYSELIKLNNCNA